MRSYLELDEQDAQWQAARKEGGGAGEGDARGSSYSRPGTQEGRIQDGIQGGIQDGGGSRSLTQTPASRVLRWSHEEKAALRQEESEQRAAGSRVQSEDGWAAGAMAGACHGNGGVSGCFVGGESTRAADGPPANRQTTSSTAGVNPSDDGGAAPLAQPRRCFLTLTLT